MAGYKHLEIPMDFERYVRDKKTSAKSYYSYLLSRIQRMFQYKNLPDTIPHEILDRYLFMNGIALITKVNDKLYCFYGNAGGPQDVYYRPTQFIVANPHIKVKGEIFSANITIFPNDTYPELGQPTGVLIRNDSEWYGLHPLLARYSYLMAENTLTLRTADVMLRVIALITAKTDGELKSANEYLTSLEKGILGVIGESAFHDGIDLQSPPSQNGSYLTQFIEYQQYLKGSFFGDIGLSANYNMKREAIGKGESTLDQDALLPLAENMLKCRQEDLAKVNDMFGTDISVEFSSSWLTNKIETLATLSNLTQPSTPSPFGGVGQPSDSVVKNEGQFGSDDTVETDEADLGQDRGNDGASSETSETSESSENSENSESSESSESSENSESSTVMKPAGDSENEESKINDISIDEEFTEFLEDVMEQKEDTGLTQTEEVIGGERNEPTGNEESTES